MEVMCEVERKFLIQTAVIISREGGTAHAELKLYVILTCSRYSRDTDLG